MSEMFQVLVMMAIPASVLLTVRYLNLRDERQALRESPPAGQTARQ